MSSRSRQSNGHIWRLGEVEEEATSEVTLGLTSVQLVLRAAILETFVARAVGFSRNSNKILVVLMVLVVLVVLMVLMVLMVLVVLNLESRCGDCHGFPFFLALYFPEPNP